jgi:hypothetical protein
MHVGHNSEAALRVCVPTNVVSEFIELYGAFIYILELCIRYSGLVNGVMRKGFLLYLAAYQKAHARAAIRIALEQPINAVIISGKAIRLETNRVTAKKLQITAPSIAHALVTG